MLSIFIMIGIAISFARIAHDKNRNRFLWGIIGIISYYVTQIIAGIAIAFTYPSLQQNPGGIAAISIAAGFLGVSIAYYFLYQLPDAADENAGEDDLLDVKID